RGKFSETLTVASLYPYAFGISDDKETCRHVFERLDLEYGISTAEYRGDVLYMQWDYPNMWPPTAYIAYLALKNTGNDAEAEKLKNQYLFTVDSIFKTTGQLWEKYNAKELTVSKTVEYETPPMMGWTAAVYEYFYNIDHNATGIVAL
ncbi:MAG: trehalase family glycosidase, partial [Eubacteriales bacterium]|nr:trehalase family glycosidase [Eubacteriales bacterium]